MIELGDIARDTITGFQGVVICRMEWLNGCPRLVLQPQEVMKDTGKTVEPETFDETQLELVKSGGKKTWSRAAQRETGGPRPGPVRSPRVRMR